MSSIIDENLCSLPLLLFIDWSLIGKIVGWYGYTLFWKSIKEWFSHIEKPFQGGGGGEVV